MSSTRPGLIGKIDGMGRNRLEHMEWYWSSDVKLAIEIKIPRARRERKPTLAQCYGADGNCCVFCVVLRFLPSPLYLVSFPLVRWFLHVFASTHFSCSDLRPFLLSDSGCTSHFEGTSFELSSLVFTLIVWKSSEGGSEAQHIR